MYIDYLNIIFILQELQEPTVPRTPLPYLKEPFYKFIYHPTWYQNRIHIINIVCYVWICP